LCYGGPKMNAQRSGIPKVIGILMIVFASLGLLVSLAGLAGNSAEGVLKEVPEWKTWSTLSMVFGLIGLGISVLHLIGGISAVRYKASAPKLAVTYAVANIASNLAQAIIVFAWLKPALSKFPGAAEAVGAFLVIGIIIALIWPTIVLVLMTRPSAKEACVN
jgi:hypothetical protein